MRQAEAVTRTAGAVTTAPGRPATRKPGRPRSAQADEAILEAAQELFAESGVAGVGMEAVAARAGVGKATVYRRWSSKEDLLLDALTALKSPLPEPQGTSVRDDLTAMLTVMCRDAADPRWARRYSLLLGEGQNCPKVMERYKRTVVEPRRELVRSVLRRGTTTGELRPDADIEVGMLLLTGAAFACGKYDGHWEPDEYAARAVDELLTGLAPR